MQSIPQQSFEPRPSGRAPARAAVRAALRLAVPALAILAVVLCAAGAPGVASAANFYDPVGNHDRADCDFLAGWAKDGDTTLPTQVHIYKGGPSWGGGTFVTAVWADRYRGDLPFTDKEHGFKIATPAAFFTGCTETVWIHAINIDTDGNFVPGATNPLLNNTGRPVFCGTPDPDCFGGFPPPSQ